MTIILEITAACPDSLAAAVSGGADRIELCSALELGGLTPSAGLIAGASALPLPVHVLIRPRSGNMCYSAAELAAMCADIAFVRQAGLAGVVIGAARPDDRLDEVALRQMIDAAGDLPVTLHRVFDCTPDPFEALEQAVALGFTRILTSGQAPTALAGAPLLAKLVQRAGGRIEIMAGAGVTPETVPDLLRQVRPDALHASASTGAAASPRHLEFGFALGPRRITDAARVQALRRLL